MAFHRFWDSTAPRHMPFPFKQHSSVHVLPPLFFSFLVVSPPPPLLPAASTIFSMVFHLWPCPPGHCFVESSWAHRVIVRVLSRSVFSSGLTLSPDVLGPPKIISCVSCGGPKPRSSLQNFNIVPTTTLTTKVLCATEE